MWLHERKWKDNHWVHLHSPSVLVTSHTRSCDDSSVQSKGQNAKRLCECTIETTEIEYWWITRRWSKPGEKESNKQRLRSGHRLSWRRRCTVFRSPSPRIPSFPGLFFWSSPLYDNICASRFPGPSPPRLIFFNNF